MAKRVFSICCKFDELPITPPLDDIQNSDGTLIATDANGMHCFIYPLSNGRYNFHVWKFERVESEAKIEVVYNATATLKRSELENLFTPNYHE